MKQGMLSCCAVERTASPRPQPGATTQTNPKAIGRNPDASNEIQTNMFIGIAFAEAIAIYALVVALILLFVV